MTQVAYISTKRPDLRSEITGWTYEDSDLLVWKAREGRFFIGFTPSPKDIPNYSCILQMLNGGWKLLGPPVKDEWNEWDWWLTREPSVPTVKP
jgi:hypothetical protein